MRKSRLSLDEAKEKYPDSVSYTHLDVYKRQTQIGMNGGSSRRNGGVVGLSLIHI